MRFRIGIETPFNAGNALISHHPPWYCALDSAVASCKLSVCALKTGQTATK
jgi:hypothetical protein